MHADRGVATQEASTSFKEKRSDLEWVSGLFRGEEVNGLAGLQEHGSNLGLIASNSKGEMWLN